MPELVVEHISKRLGTNEVLKDISVQLERGQVVALLGPSGSGKTTLLRCVAGLERPDAGRILLGHFHTSRPSCARRPVPGYARCSSICSSAPCTSRTTRSRRSASRTASSC